jgi:PrtD family type I secretion system ABC transporter
MLSKFQPSADQIRAKAMRSLQDWKPWLKERLSAPAWMKGPKRHSLFWAEGQRYRAGLAALLLFSFIISLASLTPTLFMLQLYERVMQSRSGTTLVFLLLIVAILLAIWTALESVRINILQRLAVSLHHRAGRRLFEAINRASGKYGAATRNTMLQDMNTVRDFVGGNLVVQLLDLCFAPVFIIVAFLFHPILGAALLALIAIIVGLTLVHQRLVRDDIRRSQSAGSQAIELGRAIIASAGPVRVMGMLPALTSRWHDKQTEMLGWQQQGWSRAEFVLHAHRFLRHAQGPLMMTVGTLLFLDQQMGASVIFAASILSSRAIQPIDAVVSGWRAFWMVRLSAGRLESLLAESIGQDVDRFALPRPAGPLVVSRASVTAPGRDTLILNDVSFTALPGRVLGVLGASGAGKSSLARLLVGIWRPRRGAVTLDGHDIAHWDQDALGCHLGYVPQEVELLPGSVAENIGRFQGEGGLDHEAVLEAVELAGIEDIIRGLPDGLNTMLGPDGHVPSGGQRQRIALARAVYGNPSLLVLDEPNANLDAIGEENLAQTMARMRDRGAIVVIVTHRMNMINYCDDVMVLHSGTVHAFGAREQIVARLANNRAPQKLAVVRSGP